MARWFPLLGSLLLLATACATTSSPRTHHGTIDPVREPSVVGSIDEAVMQAGEEAVTGAVVGRRVGRVAGVIAAIFGGPASETVDDMVDRYRRTRDAATIVGAVIGAAHGAMEGSERGYEFDAQFAELGKIEGVTALRPYPDQIEVRFAPTVGDETISAIAAVFIGKTPRTIDIYAADDIGLDLRDALLDRGVAATCLNVHRDDKMTDVLLRVQYEN